ncbi:hypothetical protein [Nocardia shimofusensis]|uniref:hypothetical protein n=1 Tax=Nocardia shimofusensis TaxID=228596 RepID=UPI0008379ABB|nr:hypothetical protein [Nocardia shimofusensis]
MELPDYLRIARRRWPILLAGPALGIGLAAYQVQATPQTYTASSSMYVSMATGTSVADSYQGGLAAQQRVRSYLELVTSDTVVDRVIGQLSLDTSRGELAAQIGADSPPATTLLQVYVTDENPERARVIADEVVSQMRALIHDLETIERSAAPAARVAVVDRAELPTEPDGGGGTSLLAAGAVGGLLLGAVAAYLLERFSRRPRDLDDLEPFGVPLLGTVDLGGDAETAGLRAVRARLPETATPLLVTGAGAGSAPGFAAALAGAMAATGRRVLLIDADTTGAGTSTLLPVTAGNWPIRESATLHRTTVAAGHDYLENATLRTTKIDLRTIPAAVPADEPVLGPHIPGGLDLVLRGEARLDDTTTNWTARGITVLTLGTADARTPDLIASARFTALLAEAAQRYDHVIVETAAPGDAADAAAVAARSAGVLAVTVLGDATTTRIEQDLAALGAAGGQLTGLVAVPSRRTLWQRLSGRDTTAPVPSAATPPAVPAPNPTAATAGAAATVDAAGPGQVR